MFEIVTGLVISVIGGLILIIALLAILRKALDGEYPFSIKTLIAVWVGLILFFGGVQMMNKHVHNTAHLLVRRNAIQNKNSRGSFCFENYFRVTGSKVSPCQE